MSLDLAPHLSVGPGFRLADVDPGSTPGFRDGKQQGVEALAAEQPELDRLQELAHDFLWRVRKELPEPGQLAVFDRSHYEDVLIGRVRKLADADEIERRYG